MFFEHIPPVATLFLVLYGVTGAVPLLATLYLLLRRGNAFAADVTPPVRLRRWAAAFFAVSVLGHVWWLLFYILSSVRLSAGYVAVVVLDGVSLSTTIAGTMLAMLQDRRRPVWPVFVAQVPFVALGGALMVWPGDPLLYVAIAYALLLFVLFSIYMVFALRQYGQWLRDNYADLERKEIWQSQLLLLAFTMLFIFYALVDSNMTLIFVLHVIEIVLFALLLWRVETLPQLDEAPMGQECEAPEATPPGAADMLPATADMPEKAVEATAATSATATESGGTAPDTAAAQVPAIPPQVMAKPAATPPQGEQHPAAPPPQGERLAATPSGADHSGIGLLLEERCMATQIYLQHDLTLHQLAKALGTNRTYLSRYFSATGTTYNSYINDLRIRHFVNRYREAVRSNKPVTAQQLASISGYRNYSTFSLAFKQRMGQSVTTWMREQESDMP